MIMSNKSRENDDFAAVFTKILHAAGQYWSEVSRSKLNKIASGFMVACGNRMIKAELSLNDIKSRLSLIIRFKPKDRLKTDEIYSVLRFQNRLAGLCSFLSIDDEDNIVILKTVLPVYEQNPEATVKPLFEDTLSVLEDEQLLGILN